MTRTVIVGGGIIGVALARRLATEDDNNEVVLCERDQLGGGTTARSVALFSWLPVPPTQFDLTLRRDAWETYRPFVEDGTFSFHEIGALHVAESTDRRRVLEEAAASFADLAPDRTVTVLEPEELAALGISPTGTTGGLYAPDVGYLDPHEVVTTWAEEARAAGASIRTGVGVTDIDVAEGTVSGVRTTDGRIEADLVVNAAGPWAPRVNAMVDVSLPLRHTRGPILVLEAGHPIDLPYVLFESGAYFRGEGETKALAGRLAKEFDRAETLDPDVPPRVEEAFYRDVADRTGARIPALADATVVNDWLGLRTVTPDKRPILGQTTVDGFLVATGMSGLGVTLAPAVADRLADFLGTGAAIDDRLTASRFSTAD